VGADEAGGTETLQDLPCAIPTPCCFAKLSLLLAHHLPFADSHIIQIAAFCFELFSWELQKTREAV
jgi:hypothetical protein